jgi:predicted metal-dependent phosphoesterase TrpH
MGLLLDIHTHTRRYSSCGRTDPDRIIHAAIRAGLDGLVITEHHHQWTDDEVAELCAAADAPGFLVMAGFEYTSCQGDMLIYGLPAHISLDMKMGQAAAPVIDYVHRMGGVCIAAHPTRSGMGYDESIFSLDFDAIEVQSTNLKEHEQRLASKLAAEIGKPGLAASDAHVLQDIGRYLTEFMAPVRSMKDLCDCLRSGEFQIPKRPGAKVAIL